jgi:hypothetical protein
MRRLFYYFFISIVGPFLASFIMAPWVKEHDYFTGGLNFRKKSDLMVKFLIHCHKVYESKMLLLRAFFTHNIVWKIGSC